MKFLIKIKIKYQDFWKKKKFYEINYLKKKIKFLKFKESIMNNHNKLKNK